jgi:hypothetical protein
MIKRYGYGEFSTYDLVCDWCGLETDNGFELFNDVVVFKKRSSWKSRKDAFGKWEDICPECQ